MGGWRHSPDHSSTLDRSPRHFTKQRRGSRHSGIMETKQSAAQHRSRPAVLAVVVAAATVVAVTFHTVGVCSCYLHLHFLHVPLIILLLFHLPSFAVLSGSLSPFTVSLQLAARLQLTNKHITPAQLNELFVYSFSFPFASKTHPIASKYELQLQNYLPGAWRWEGARWVMQHGIKGNFYSLTEKLVIHDVCVCVCVCSSA